MTHTLFIDGAEGTTGLEIRQRLRGRDDFALIELADAERRDPDARRSALAKADFAILCLPDEAARESVRLAEGSGVRIIDASTAHRTDPDWVYGFPEMTAGQRAAIASAGRVANPGCYAVSYVALARPLAEAGLIVPGTVLTVHATSGYSGGGKPMIAEFEDSPPTAFRTYALSLEHKHLPEMRAHSGLDAPPVFSPAVANTYRGMLVEIPLHRALLARQASAADIAGIYRAHYRNSTTVIPPAEGMARPDHLTIERCAQTDRIEILVFDNPASGQIRLCAALDNLGKGAAGSAVQNLNLMAGAGETSGLSL